MVHEHKHPGHDHKHHDHDHAHPTPSSHTTFFLAVFLNTAFTFIQIVYAYLSHSTSLLADAGHNFSDVLALLFSWLAFYLATKKSTPYYSYGYKKSTVLATLANAVFLVIACTLILVDAITHIIHPPTIAALPVIIVALIGIGINGGSALLFLKKSKHDLNFNSAFLHLMYDAVISLSVVIAGVIVYFTHWNIIDPLLGIIITTFILKNSLQLLKKTIDLSLDGVPKAIDFQKVQAYLLTLPDVRAVHDLHIWAMSTTENALTAHLLRASGNFSETERQAISHTLQHDFNIHHTTIQIEEHLAEECLHEQTC